MGGVHILVLDQLTISAIPSISCLLSSIIFIIILSPLHLYAVPCSCQEISALGIEESLCPGESIILTCETRGSSTIAWRSTDYIGDMSDQLEFSRFSSTGVPNNSPVYNTTTAILTANREDNGVRVLISQLHITVRSDVSSTSVICVRDNEMEDIATLRLLSMLLSQLNNNTIG